jgi:integrase/recombinase XerD
MLSSLRRFYQYLKRESVVDNDPTLLVESPKLAKKLPDSLTEQDVELLLSAPDVSDPVGLRDRTMFELLYAAGLRVSELTNLAFSQVNLHHGVVQIVGKGGKERIVPVGDTAIHWLKQYIQQSRPELIKGVGSEALFPGRSGGCLTRQAFWHRIKHYSQQVGITKPLSPHTLRHAFATHLLNHGADLRVVQLLLGHSSLSTTQIYTHIAQHRMQSLHQSHHPRG